MSQVAVSDGRAIFLVGGGGFLGTNLTCALVTSGYRVINFSRSHLCRLEESAVQYVSAFPENLEDTVAQSSCVFHMAHGSSPASALNEMERNLASSMDLTFALMRACARQKVPFVFLSSGGAIYGPDVPIPTPEVVTTFPISPYGVEKLVAERYLHIAALHFGLDYRVLRISNPYGPWQLGTHGQGVIGTWMRRILEGQDIEIWGDGSVQRDYIYVGDVCDALLRVITYRGAERIFNIGSGQGQSLSQLIEHLLPLCGDALRVVYREACPAHVPVSILDSSLAARELGWNPCVDISDGLALAWKWMHSHDCQ